MHLTQPQIDRLEAMIDDLNRAIDSLEQAIDNLESRKAMWVDHYDTIIDSVNLRKQQIVDRIVVIRNTYLAQINEYYDSLIVQIENKYAALIARQDQLCALQEAKFQQAIAPLVQKISINENILAQWKSNLANATNPSDRRYWTHQVMRQQKVVDQLKRQLANAQSMHAQRMARCTAGWRKLRDDAVALVNRKRAEAIAALNARYSTAAIEAYYDGIIAQIEARKAATIAGYDTSIARLEDSISYLQDRIQRITDYISNH